VVDFLSFLIRGARARVLGPAAIQPLNPGQFLSKAGDLVRAARSWKAT